MIAFSFSNTCGKEDMLSFKRHFHFKERKRDFFKRRKIIRVKVTWHCVRFRRKKNTQRFQLEILNSSSHDTCGQEKRVNWINKPHYHCLLILAICRVSSRQTVAPSNPKTVLTYKQPISIPSRSTPSYQLDLIWNQSFLLLFFYEKTKEDWKTNFRIHKRKLKTFRMKIKRESFQKTIKLKSTAEKFYWKIQQICLGIGDSSFPEAHKMEIYANFKAWHVNCAPERFDQDHHPELWTHSQTQK